ncbi:MAG: hydantoinase/oxoprolinase family protein, partial [bacterium]
MAHGGYRIGVDTGSTFTDVVAVRAGDGAVFLAKVASTPSDPTQALDSAIRVILERTGAAPDEVSALIHGTTEATNALLGRQDHNMCLVVTEGFRHILEISRQNAPDGFGDSFFWVKPQRLVPPDRVYEVSARMDHRGVELAPLDEETARDMAYLCKKREIEAAGICLLHSYANPAHELRLREIFAEEHPDCHVSLSCEVLPEHQEYERAVTTLLDAACKPVLKSYLDRAIARVAGDLSGSTPFFIMKSNGGITSARRAAVSPLQTAASGPAAGVHACAAMAAAAGLRKIITLDAGGTSTDVSVVEEGVPAIAARSKLGIHTVRVPMVDIVTAAVGSGSVAWISRDGRIRVGPRSAGADPGPMCYGKGGDEPTVADAQCFLGLLPDRLAGGEIVLDRARAAEGIGRIAEKLKISPEEAAKGILEIAAWNQAQSIRQLTVQRGKDPREYALVAFGGAGPIMAAGIAGTLGAGEVIVPPLPGCLSARGLIDAGLRNDYIKTHVAPLEEASSEGILADFESMRENAEADLGAENIAAEDQVFSRSMDLRYAGDGHEVTVELPAGEPLSGALEGAAARFHEAHRLRFGFDHEGRAPVEVVNLRLTAEGGSNHVPRD